jgi:hypothetical protein
MRKWIQPRSGERMQPTAQAVGRARGWPAEPRRGRKKRPGDCKPARAAGIKLVNFPTSQTSCCIPSHTSAINNSPRAVVWLAGRIVCNSRARPASNVLRGHKSLQLSRPRDFIRRSNTVSEGYLQSKDLQKDLFSIFCLPIGMRRKWRLSDRKAILLRVFERPV